MRRLAILAAAFSLTIGSGIDRGAASDTVVGGGLHFAPHPQLKIDSLDLVLSTELVKLTYGVRTTSKSELAVMVTFPLPDIDRSTLGDDPATSSQRDPVNTVGANANVDGQPVDMLAQQRALALGLDVTSILETSGLPLLPSDPGLEPRIAELEPQILGDLIERGILIIENGENLPNWTLQATAFWRQRFVAGRTTKIELSYSPIVGFATARAEMIARAADQYCLEKSLLDELNQRASASQPATFVFLHYGPSHATAAASEPIPRFRLLVELPENVTHASTCAGTLKATSGRNYEWRTEQFEPDTELTVLFVQ